MRVEWLETETHMENNETTPETATETPDAPVTPEPAPPAEAQAPTDPSVIGRMTPEEHNGMMKIRAESQQLLAKVGEHELLKLRIMARVEELDEQGQGLIAGVTKRLGLDPGTQWHGMQDGTIRLVNRPAAPQTPPGGADASS